MDIEHVHVTVGQVIAVAKEGQAVETVVVVVYMTYQCICDFRGAIPLILLRMLLLQSLQMLHLTGLDCSAVY